MHLGTGEEITMAKAWHGGCFLDKNANDAVLPWIVRFWALELSQIDTYSFQALLCA